MFEQYAVMRAAFFVCKPKTLFVAMNRSKKNDIMKYLTLDYIKQHIRIDHDCEDTMLELYGNAAEETVLNLLGRSYDDLLERYSVVPSAVMQATLMLVDVSYQYRSPVSPTSVSMVPYTFDLLIKPYMVL